MRTIVYSQVSTQSQERDGASLETQERACLQLAQAAGYIVVDCMREATSGRQPDEPGMARVRRPLRRQGGPSQPSSHRTARS